MIRNTSRTETSMLAFHRGANHWRNFYVVSTVGVLVVDDLRVKDLNSTCVVKKKARDILMQKKKTTKKRLLIFRGVLFVRLIRFAKQQRICWHDRWERLAVSWSKTKAYCLKWEALARLQMCLICSCFVFVFSNMFQLYLQTLNSCLCFNMRKISGSLNMWKTPAEISSWRWNSICLMRVDLRTHVGHAAWFSFFVFHLSVAQIQS